MSEWMPALECLYIKHIQSNQMHDDFRWWFISDSMVDDGPLTNPLPLVILRDAVKCVYQSPPGITPNMAAEYESGLMNHGDTFSSTMLRTKWYRFGYALNAFHAIVNERRQFGAIGWSRSYEFDASLLHDSVDYLKRVLKQCDELPYKEFLYLIGDCLYANEVIDSTDRRLMSTMLRQFCNENVVSVDNYRFFEHGQLCIPLEAQPDNSVHYLNSLSCGANDVGLHGNCGYRRSVRDGYDVRLFLIFCRMSNLSLLCAEHRIFVEFFWENDGFC